jgi:hypothetical protein
MGRQGQTLKDGNAQPDGESGQVDMQTQKDRESPTDGEPQKDEQTLTDGRTLMEDRHANRWTDEDR